MKKRGGIDVLLRLRLSHQGLARPGFARPEDAVAWFGAVQAQDYLGSLWAIGQRTRAATEATVAAAESRRAIVRTWPMRGTLHFVAADDVRWMTRLLAPRVMARNAARVAKEFDVDARVLGRSAEVLERALEGGRRLTREELYQALEARRIRTGGSRGLHILVWLSMRGTLCHAGRRGKQQTFALLDEWIPASRELEGDAALAELALRYFRSHGPATQKDFTWWAGITARQATSAIDGLRGHLERWDTDGRMTYWWLDTSKPSLASSGLRVRLLPAFDEYTVGYHYRSLIAAAPASRMSLLSPAVLVDGRVVGRWTRALSRSGVVVSTSLQRKLSPAECKALADAERRYAEFVAPAAA